MASKLWQRFRKEWDATKGNLWWAVFCSLFTSFGGGTLTAYLAKTFVALAHLPSTNMMGYFIIGALVSLTIAICFVFAKRQLRDRFAIARYPAPEETVPETVASPQREVDFYGTVEQLHFRKSPDNDGYGYILLAKIQITNRGQSEAAIMKWKVSLCVGEEVSEGNAIALPPDIAVRRSEYQSLLNKTDVFEQIEPDLRKLTYENPLKRAVPKQGWVNFYIPSYQYEPAINARMIFIMSDSLGQDHYIVRDPQNFRKDGEIVPHESPSIFPRIGNLLGGGR